MRVYGPRVLVCDAGVRGIGSDRSDGGDAGRFNVISRDLQRGAMLSCQASESRSLPEDRPESGVGAYIVMVLSRM
jgi:hypothetical protein